MDRGVWGATVHGDARVGHNLVTTPPPPNWENFCDLSSRKNQYQSWSLFLLPLPLPPTPRLKHRYCHVVLEVSLGAFQQRRVGVPAFPHQLLCVCSVMSDSETPGCSVHGIFQTRILEWVSFLLQGSFLTQGLNLCLLHWRVDSLPLSHWGSPSLKSLLTWQ